MKPSDASEPKRMGRPPKISREEILAAAAHKDMASLQLTTLADELGISVKTIYYYFSGRQALIDGLTEQVVTQMSRPDISELNSWQAVMREAALWHCRLAGLKGGWLNDPNAPIGIRRVAIEVLRDSCRKMTEFGWTMHNGYRAYVIVSNWAIAHGQASLNSSMDGDYAPENLRAVLEQYDDASLSDDLTLIMLPFRTADELFEDGLTIILKGIESLIANAD